MDEYNSIINSCKKESWIKEEKVPDGRKFITTTTEGEDIMSLSDGIEKLVTTYPKLLFIVVFISGVFWLGGKWVYNFLALKLNLPILP